MLDSIEDYHRGSHLAQAQVSGSICTVYHVNFYSFAPNVHLARPLQVSSDVPSLAGPAELVAARNSSHKVPPLPSPSSSSRQVRNDSVSIKKARRNVFVDVRHNTYQRLKGAYDDCGRVYLSSFSCFCTDSF